MLGIIDGTGKLILRLLWKMDLVHVKEWDNTPSPYLKAVKQEEPQTENTEQEEDTRRKEYEFGAADPTQEKTIVEFYEQALNEEDADAAWSFSRYDGKSNTPNLSAWSEADEYAIRVKKLNTEVKRANYKKVRALVIQGKKNRQIAEEFGKKISWAETYGAACRLMVRIRLKELEVAENSPSPTQEEGEA